MTLEEQVSQQRVKHIVNSYQLDGNEAEQFAIYLERLLEIYAPPLIELALAETLMANWLALPMPKGISFLQQVHARLHHWQAAQTIVNTLRPDQFQQITGLDPMPVFGAFDVRPAQPIGLRRSPHGSLGHRDHAPD
jgi:hypothetical protein